MLAVQEFPTTYCKKYLRPTICETDVGPFMFPFPYPSIPSLGIVRTLVSPMRLKYRNAAYYTFQYGNLYKMLLYFMPWALDKSLGIPSLCPTTFHLS